MTVTGTGRPKPPLYSDRPDDNMGGNKNYNRHNRLGLLTLIQIIGCIVVFCAALVLRFIGGPWYHNVQEWYFSVLDDSIIAQEQIENVGDKIVGLWSDLSNASPGGSSQSSGLNAESSQNAGTSSNSSQVNETTSSGSAENGSTDSTAENSL